MTKVVELLSLGAGVQSSTLALMAAHGEITPMPDGAIFADTHGEPKAVYEWLAWLTSKLPFPVYKVSRGDLWKAASTPKRTRDGLRTYILTGIPVFMMDGLKKGLGMRQCTRDFKIDVITRQARALTGVKRVTKAHGVLVNMWIGISTDEAHRMKPNRQQWISTRWPLIDAGMSRTNCFEWMDRHGYPKPPRSACTYCPYHDDKSWLGLTDAEFADAVVKEKQLQAAYASTSEMRGVPYFHASRVPLDQVLFDPDDATGAAFGNECEGICGV